jgi:superfamily II DNA/RNA helicase
MVVNYDLPWNPQRIEQRIGRCHRYGQRHDVVVINFLNRANAADLRVFELLDEKFRLFSGLFGASDELLGAIESGVATLVAASSTAPASETSTERASETTPARVISSRRQQGLRRFRPGGRPGPPAPLRCGRWPGRCRLSRR